MEELVFAIPAHLLWNILVYSKKGFIHGNHEVLNRIVQQGLFRKRNELEEDPSFKQLIPYAIISYQEPEHTGARQRQSFYMFKRTSGQTEKRLHNKLHLGVGGHMKPGSSTKLNEQYPENELRRELFEEVNLLDGCVIEGIEFIGFINDDTLPVSRVHIGLLYDIHLSNKQVVVNETDKMTAEWIDQPDLAEYYEEMETWTKIAIDSYIQVKKESLTR